MAYLPADIVVQLLERVVTTLERSEALQAATLAETRTF
jgi:hypothetical protein